MWWKSIANAWNLFPKSIAKMYFFFILNNSLNSNNQQTSIESFSVKISKNICFKLPKIKILSSLQKCRIIPSPHFDPVSSNFKWKIKALTIGLKPKYLAWMLVIILRIYFRLIFKFRTSEAFNFKHFMSLICACLFITISQHAVFITFC